MEDILKIGISAVIVVIIGLGVIIPFISSQATVVSTIPGINTSTLISGELLTSNLTNGSSYQLAHPPVDLMQGVYITNST